MAEECGWWRREEAGRDRTAAGHRLHPRGYSQLRVKIPTKSCSKGEKIGEFPPSTLRWSFLNVLFIWRCGGDGSGDWYVRHLLPVLHGSFSNDKNARFGFCSLLICRCLVLESRSVKTPIWGAVKGLSTSQSRHVLVISSVGTCARIPAACRGRGAWCVCPKL